MTKIEQVARAIWAERQKAAISAGLHLKEWDDETHLLREDVRREARAAIEAMRMGRKGQRCAVTARAKVMNSIRVEFSDGYVMITSGNSIRRGK